MKTLNIPYIEGLETMPRTELENALKTEGAHDAVDNAPWAEFPYKPRVTFDIAASESHLFVQFHVEGLGLKAEFGNTNEPVWQDSCVEVFIADPDGNGYRNFETNCIGTLLSAHQKGRGVDVTPISQTDAEKVIRYTSLPSETFSEKEGEHRWSLIVGIPFELIGYKNRPDSVRANLYKCADGSRWPHYLSWAPIHTPQPDFHRPEFFGTLLLQQ